MSKALAIYKGVDAAVSHLRDALLDAALELEQGKQLNDERITTAMNTASGRYAEYKKAVNEVAKEGARLQALQEAANDRRRRARAIQKCYQVGTRVRLGEIGTQKKSWERGTVCELVLLGDGKPIDGPTPHFHEGMRPKTFDRYTVRYRVRVDKRHEGDDDRIAEITGRWTLEPLNELPEARPLTPAEWGEKFEAMGE